jgi:hypothetical protein
VGLTVAVEGTKNHLKLQTDEGIINIQKPFQPFGVRGNATLYIGSDEIFSKTLTSLKLDQLTWDNKPDFSSYYALYNKKYNATIDNNSYIAQSKNLITGQWSDPLSTFNIFDAFWNLKGNGTWLPSAKSEEVSFFTQGITLDGFLSVKKSAGTFFNDTYAELLLIQAQATALLVDTAQSRTNRLKADAIYSEKNNSSNLLFGYELLAAPAIQINNYFVPIPNAPFIPTLSTFTLSYEASATDLSLVQLHPYEDTFRVYQNSKKTSLLPHFDYKGNLFIALENAQADSNISLLFKFAEYTGNSDLELPPIKWFYLKANNAWQELIKELDFQDDTEGFAQTGIINFELPEDAALEHTILPSGFHWLKGSVAQDMDAFDRLVAVHAQAGKAVFTPSALSDLERLNIPLPEKSIAKPVIENASVAKITQPYASFSGVVAEKGDAFYRRVSEHLRHKGRAVNVWDYEALVLEQFPEIYKVKCLNHTKGLRGLDFDFEILPSHITLVVIPDVRKLPQAQRERPKATQNMLGDITRFLKERISPFVNLQVMNPRYEDVNVRFNVKFKIGKDDNFYKKQLEEDLKGFLSPWTMAEPSEIQFGGQIYASSVLGFVEGREYVDFVTDFNLFQTDNKSFDGEGTFQCKLVDAKLYTNKITAQTARSVLASGYFCIETNADC